MNPGLVVKLRPAGPWRIGPDSGARNQVDAIYHSDSLYAAVTSAMARLGSLAGWLDATARSATPEVCFSSCFPFVDEIGFVPPPRTVWPPPSPSSMGGRVRWKSARFVPLGIVQSILAGHRLDENQWTVDGASECLVPAGRHGPFRTGLRSNAAVDRLTGSTERHSTACLEFQAGAGLWAVVSFRDEAARERWIAPVQAAFRWLADSGFGGERSRGWGRSEPPEFVEGTLPEMILGSSGARGDSGAGGQKLGAGGQGPGAGEDLGAAADQAPSSVPPVEDPPSEEPTPVPPLEEPPSEEPPVQEPPTEQAAQRHTPDIAAMPAPTPASPDEEADQQHTPDKAATPDAPAPGPWPPAPELPPAPDQAPGPLPSAPDQAHWLLSLFTPAPDDSVDWRRGNYTLLTRSGRVDASGELKKQLPMVAEGSVVYAPVAPRGSAPDVAPDGFPHPVFRAGFAVSIPLPEVSG